MEPNKEVFLLLGAILIFIGIRLMRPLQFGAFLFGTVVLLFGIFFITIPFAKSINKQANKFKVWLKDKEQQELQQLDIEIIAAETNMLVTEYDSKWVNLISDTTLGIKLADFYPRTFIYAQKSKNEFLLFKHQLFDSNDLEFAGLAVKLGYQTVPAIAVVHRSVIEQISFYKLKNQELNFQSLPISEFPSWLSSKNYALFYAAKSREEIVDFLAKNENLSQITQESSARLICLNENKACVFFNEVFKADIYTIRYFKRLAVGMFDLFGSTPDLK